MVVAPRAPTDWTDFGIQSASFAADLADSHPFWISSLSAPLANAIREYSEIFCVAVFLAGFVLISRSMKERQVQTPVLQSR